MNPSMSRSAFPSAAPSVAVGLLLTALGAFAADPVSVATAKPTRGDITRHVALPGSLRANQQVVLQARVAGFVRTVLVDRGDRVSSGQVLAEIEVPELLSERTKRAAEVRVAEIEARRLEEGRRKSPDLVPQQSLDTATGRLEVARAELEKTETLLGFATLRAPFAGTVTSRMVDPGAFVAAGSGAATSAVLTLADTSVLRAVVPVPESEALRVRQGQPVRVTVEGTTNVFAGKVSRHAGALDEATRSLVVEADLPNDDDALRPGMFATVRIGLERRTGALLVRTDALAVEKAGAFVFRIDNGVCRKTAVKTGFQDGAVTEIVSGLAEDAVLVVPAKSAPTDGTPVRTEGTR
jgi:membrane fusion protein, multidrug efflux system